jgi:uncharacterized integral membrane protein (TIGR00697 family)
MDNAVDITKTSRYFLYIALMFVAVLMISNTVAVKLIQIGPFIFAGGIFIFPISYIFGDILTEVYGYRASRKIIWSGFVALILMSLGYVLVEHLPAPAFWTGQSAYDMILGFVPRIVIASIIGYFFGEFCNSYVMSRMKVWMEGRALWSRIIGSTLVGEGIDTLLFVTIAFLGTLPLAAFFTLVFSNYIFKVAYEIVVIPITYRIVSWLKRSEGIDVYDRGISYGIIGN